MSAILKISQWHNHDILAILPVGGGDCSSGLGDDVIKRFTIDDMLAILPVGGGDWEPGSSGLGDDVVKRFTIDDLFFHFK